MAEEYGLNWQGKSNAMRQVLSPATGTLLLCSDKSINFDKSDNLIVEGDNLDALKLLKGTYGGQAKLVFIDPPYNTGVKFIYPDNLTHSQWLSMMYPRLSLGRDFLGKDGTMFVAIGDQEIHNLRFMMDEIFGEENFVATIVWEKSYAPKSACGGFSTSHDYLLAYAKDINSWSRHLLPRTATQDERYSNPDDDPNGPWMSDNLLKREHRDNGFYDIIGPTGKKWTPGKGMSWTHSKKEMDDLIKNGEVWFGQDGNGVPRLKRFLKNVQQGVVPGTIWKHSEVGHSQDAKREIIDLFGYAAFPTPKPTGLVKRAATICADKDSLILDFFAGSGTTAQAVLELNEKDGGNRKFILVQSPEPTGDKEYPTVSEICRARIEKLVRKLDKKRACWEGSSATLGFKFLRLCQK